MQLNLAEALANFEEEAVLKEIEIRLAKEEDPVSIIRELQDGMCRVGERFDQGTYYLSELMMSADLFSSSMKLLEPRLEGLSRDFVGRIVVGTPKGDIHDLGKNIFTTVIKAAGFEVHDLGVDVPVDRFIETIEQVRPDILGFSALITTSFETMKNVVDTLVEKGLRDELKIIIGGGVTTETVLKYVGADGQTIDAMAGVDMCKEFIGINK